MIAYPLRHQRHPEMASPWERRWYSVNHLMQSSEIRLRMRIDGEIHEGCARLREYRRRLHRADECHRPLVAHRIRETSRSLEHLRALRREGLS
jgi:hypothetical protein